MADYIRLGSDTEAEDVARLRSRLNGEVVFVVETVRGEYFAVSGPETDGLAGAYYILGQYRNGSRQGPRGPKVWVDTL
jgi:hypothetical protein